MATGAIVSEMRTCAIRCQKGVRHSDRSDCPPIFTVLQEFLGGTLVGLDLRESFLAMVVMTTRRAAVLGLGR
jgi:hypothetical protein